MKKLFLLLTMLVSSFHLLDAAAAQYRPATGPLNFSDTTSANKQVTARGSIMQIVANNNPANAGVDPSLAAANNAIAIFDGQGQNFKAYQDIMTNLKQAINSTQALNAVTAFETVIMNMYDYRAYLLGNYRCIQSIFITGIRYTWFNPISYFSPKSWLSDNDAELKQLIDELYNLADIATIHNSVVGARIKTTAHSYRHWRRNLALGTLAYLAADCYSQGFDKSVINIFSEQGLVNGCSKIGKNISTDMQRGAQAGYKYSTLASKKIWNSVIKPISTRLLFGIKDHESNDNTDSYWSRLKKKMKAANEKNPWGNDEPSQPWHLTAYAQDSWKSYLKTFQATAAKTA